MDFFNGLPILGSQQPPQSSMPTLPSNPSTGWPVPTSGWNAPSAPTAAPAPTVPTTAPAPAPAPAPTVPTAPPASAPSPTPGDWQYSNPSNPAGILPIWNEFLNQGPASYLPFDPIAGFNPMQEQAWQTGLGAADQIAQLTQDMMNKWNSWASNPGQFTPSMDWFSNPHMDEAVQNALRQTTTAFNEQVMPGINTTFASQPGSTRQGIAQGLATKGLSDNLANISSQMYANMYETGKQSYLTDQANQLGARTAAMTSLPSALGAFSQGLMSPYSMQMGIGQQQQDMSQRKLDEAANRWWFEQYKNRDHLADAIGMLSGTGAGSYTSGESSSTTPGKF